MLCYNIGVKIILPGHKQCLSLVITKKNYNHVGINRRLNQYFPEVLMIRGLIGLIVNEAESLQKTYELPLTPLRNNFYASGIFPPLTK